MLKWTIAAFQVTVDQLTNVVMLGQFSVAVVGDLAYRVLWEGIVEDCTMFLRYILEKISNKEKQAQILMKVRKLIGCTFGFPPQAACILFNHLVS